MRASKIVGIFFIVSAMGIALGMVWFWVSRFIDEGRVNDATNLLGIACLALLWLGCVIYLDSGKEQKNKHEGGDK